MSVKNNLYLLSFKLPLYWLHSLTPVTSLSMLPGIYSFAVAMHLEIYWVYNLFFQAILLMMLAEIGLK
ncbi:hypothetical protein Ppb6_01949 [Photorhabdus australis subsp. thailandensis]|uniref:Uncharacterized protein n=1 Tax=Photorhabdus australis subsp. thailandensis TaxID=2805096 RepID=A0A1C0U4N0_9GAMM|nr:hypothetical protein Ppb6_01949 [Photorhabdus australis subsp. thailandensis]